MLISKSLTNAKTNKITFIKSCQTVKTVFTILYTVVSNKTQNLQTLFIEKKKHLNCNLTLNLTFI